MVVRRKVFLVRHGMISKSTLAVVADFRFSDN